MKINKILIFVIIIIIFSQISFPQFYADIKIDVENNGLVNIYGNSNYKELLTTNSQNFTSKKGNIWTLEIQTKESIDNFIFELTLPKHSQITYIKTTPSFRIDEEDNKIKIIGTGENKPLTLIIQYTIEPTEELLSKDNIIIFLGIIIIIFIIFIIYTTFKLNNKDKDTKKEIQKILKDKSKKIKHIDIEKKPKFDYSILPQRQQEIIKILKKEKKITQKKLEEIMKIPKSSISRNVNTLTQKKLIKKESAGISNYLSINKD